MTGAATVIAVYACLSFTQPGIVAQGKRLIHYTEAYKCAVSVTLIAIPRQKPPVQIVEPARYERSTKHSSACGTDKKAWYYNTERKRRMYHCVKQ